MVVEFAKVSEIARKDDFLKVVLRDYIFPVPQNGLAPTITKMVCNTIWLQIYLNLAQQAKHVQIRDEKLH